MTFIHDPIQKLSGSAQTEGGTTPFLAPKEFGKEDSVPTPQADIYAFGLVIFEVREQDLKYWQFHAHALQVLTGKTPWVQASATGSHVLCGKRPAKPENASAIGFSDSVWEFTQRCWDGDVRSRPGVAELVTHLETAAANWDRLMPPCVRVENVTADSGEPMSGSMDHCEFDTLILLCYCSLGNVQAGSSELLRASCRRVPPNRKLPPAHSTI